MLAIIKSVTIRLRKKIRNDHRIIRKEINLFVAINIEAEYSIDKESSRKLSKSREQKY